MPARNIRKTVFWFDDGKRPNVADVLEKEKDITLHRLAYNGPKADIWGAMSASHVYCTTSTRQEQPEEFRTNAALLARCPDLLVVSSSGAGYDTVDVAACTAAGVLVVNQSGGNADAVAEHAVAMMLSLTKNIPQTDRSLRSAQRAPRESFKGWNAHGRTVGVIGIGNTGRRVARICGLGLQMKVLAYDPYVSAEEVEARGATLAELLADLERRYPGMRFRMIDEQDRIRRHIRIFVNQEQARDLGAALAANDEVVIVGALSGG